MGDGRRGCGGWFRKWGGGEGGEGEKRGKGGEKRLKSLFFCPKGVANGAGFGTKGVLRKWHVKWRKVV
jgi:hypothetical protein